MFRALDIPRLFSFFCLVFTLHFKILYVCQFLIDSCRYVKSRSDQQLRHNSSVNDVSACRPEDTANGRPIVPCGLIAWSLFNDTYSFAISNRNLTVNKHGIAWKSDRDHKFGRDVFPSNFQSGGLIGGASLNESIPVSWLFDCLTGYTAAHVLNESVLMSKWAFECALNAF